MVGATLSAADLVQALRLRSELTILVNREVLKTHDAMITANGLSAAPRFDEFHPDVPPKSSVQTMPFNVTGNPVLAVRLLGQRAAARHANRRPRLRRGNGARIGAAYEAAAGWIHKRPELELRIAVQPQDRPRHYRQAHGRTLRCCSERGYW